MRLLKGYCPSPRLCVKVVCFLFLQLLLIVTVQELSAPVINPHNDGPCDHLPRDKETNISRHVLTSQASDSGPLSYLRNNGYANDLVKLEINKLTTAQLLLTLHSYLDNADVICQRKIRMGHIGDGGWEICDDPDVRPRDPCVIYSFGINDDFSFDDDAAKVYGCHLYSFDPSMTQAKMEFNRSSKVHFYRIGLSGSTHVNNKRWPMFTYADIRSKLGHSNTTIDLIKMDIEGSEWGALPQMMRTGGLSEVRQLMLEYHLTRTDRKYLLPRLKLVQSLERFGFRKFYVHKNKVTRTLVKGFPVLRTRCYEVHYLKR